MTKVKSCSVYIVTGKKEEELDVSSVKRWETMQPHAMLKTRPG